MALTLIKEDGTGKADANSYASVADGDAYFDGHLYASQWTAATTANKEKALVFATRLIDAERQFKGVKSTETQALQWPRANCPDPDRGKAEGRMQNAECYLASDQVPSAVVKATCELAKELLLQDRTTAPPGEGVIATWTDTTGTKYSKTDKRPVLSYLVQSLLAKYGVSVRRGNSVVRLVRT
ncbi:MAG: hypothetical protein HZA90_10040 [Verrucomicrobia bacterium]|nr:hypothetical protein [Verrucomicrobiota bacterium]